MNESLKYIVFIITLLIIELSYFRIAIKYNIVDKPNERSSHTQLTIRGGGIIFYFGILLYIILFGKVNLYFLSGLSLISVISFIDDIRGVRPLLRGLIHASSILCLFLGWNAFEYYPIWMICVGVFFTVGIINAYNFMDGINGITGLYSLSVLATLLYVNLEKECFIDSNFIILLTLSVFVFLFFNMRKKAKCFAGDIGSISIAYILIYVYGMLMISTNDISYFIFLSVYGIDASMTILLRLISGENILKPHRKHLYQLLSNECGLPQLRVSFSYFILQLIVNVGYLVLPSAFKWYYFSFAILSLFIIYFLVRRIIVVRFCR